MANLRSLRLLEKFKVTVYDEIGKSIDEFWCKNKGKVWEIMDKYIRLNKTKK